MVFELFSHPEQWDLVNFRLKNQLATSHQIRSFVNPFLAMHDLLISLAQLYAHKRSVAWVTGVSPLLENSQPQFVREGYHIQNIKIADLLQAPDQGQSLIEGLNKDTLFFVFFKNHALSGEIFAHEKIEEWITSKRIFFILVDHEFYTDFKLAPSSFGLQVASKDLSFSMLPERTKLGSATGAYQNISWSDQWTSLSTMSRVNLESSIKTWEGSLAQEKWTYQSTRSWDRSLLIFDSIHGDVVVERLREKGFENVKSYADCVLCSPKAIRSWIQPEISDSTLRGLISLSFKSIKDIPPKALLDDIVKDIKTESEWSF